MVTVTLEAGVNNPFKDVAGDYRDGARTKTQVSSTPDSAFQVLTLYRFALKQLYAYMHAHGGEFYNLGMGQASLAMTQSPEAMKEKKRKLINLITGK